MIVQSLGLAKVHVGNLMDIGTTKIAEDSGKWHPLHKLWRDQAKSLLHTIALEPRYRKCGRYVPESKTWHIPQTTNDR